MLHDTVLLRDILHRIAAHRQFFAVGERLAKDRNSAGDRRRRVADNFCDIFGLHDDASEDSSRSWLRSHVTADSYCHVDYICSAIPAFNLAAGKSVVEY